MLKQIKYFHTVVRCKSFTEAAEECFISQSAISQHIQTLERELGVKLLERHNRSFSLTAAGEHFYHKSLVLLADFERLRQETMRIAHKESAELRLGYLKCYDGQEFGMAVAEFSEKYPDVSVHISNGNHEDLYTALRNGSVDLILNDQRRAFSDEYVNLVLGQRNCYIEIAARNPLAVNNFVELEKLKQNPCILVASPEQRENEKVYFQEVVGFSGDFLFAENLEEARMLVVGGKGFLPLDCEDAKTTAVVNLKRLLLKRRGNPLTKTYCAFWQADNSGYYIEDFAEILQAKFAKSKN